MLQMHDNLLLAVAALGLTEHVPPACVPFSLSNLQLLSTEYCACQELLLGQSLIGRFNAVGQLVTMMILVQSLLALIPS